MNLSNKITVSRILIMPLFMMSLAFGGVLWKSIAMVCFAYACYSDWLDGSLARKNGWVTDFGKFLDPLADKIFVCAALISFVGKEPLNIPAWIVTLIISREFMITGFRTIAISKNVVLPAQMIGKSKMVVQLVAIGALILISLLYEIEKAGHLVISQGFDSFFVYVSIVVVWLAMLITVFSGIKYIYENRELLK